jgi:capsular polysaccharide transport system ATP-binding protein
MLILEKVSKRYTRGSGGKVALNALDVSLDGCNEHVGILGAKGAGKSTLLDIMAGAILPDTGRVFRGGRVSWPLTWSGFRRGMAADEQVLFLARLHGVCRKHALRFVAELSELDKKLYSPVEQLSRQERERLALATALALDFDLYLVDEAIPKVGEAHAARYASVWAERLKQRRLLLASRQAEALSGLCPTAAILDKGKLSHFMPLEEASRFYSRATNA